MSFPLDSCIMILVFCLLSVPCLAVVQLIQRAAWQQCVSYRGPAAFRLHQQATAPVHKGKPPKGTPIILVPPGETATITMWNAKVLAWARVWHDALCALG